MHTPIQSHPSTCINTLHKGCPDGILHFAFVAGADAKAYTSTTKADGIFCTCTLMPSLPHVLLHCPWVYGDIADVVTPSLGFILYMFATALYHHSDISCSRHAATAVIFPYGLLDSLSPSPVSPASKDNSYSWHTCLCNRSLHAVLFQLPQLAELFIFFCEKRLILLSKLHLVYIV